MTEVLFFATGTAPEVERGHSVSSQVEDVMDTGKRKLTKSQLKEIQKKWSSQSERRKKRKAKKLGGKKSHTCW